MNTKDEGGEGMMYIATISGFYITKLQGLDVFYDGEGKAIPEFELIELSSDRSKALMLYPSEFGNLVMAFNETRFFEAESNRELTYRDFEKMGI